MRVEIPIRLILAMLVTSVSIRDRANAPERFERGALAGFTKSPGEHIINELDGPVRLRRIAGSVFCGGSDSEPLAGVLFEVRGPGNSPRVRGVKTEKAGHFKLKHIAPGTYRLKATFNGFQSAMGTMVVDRSGSSPPRKIELHVGV